MNKVEFAIQNELDIMNKVELTGVICSLVYEKIYLFFLLYFCLINEFLSFKVLRLLL